MDKKVYTEDDVSKTEIVVCPECLGKGERYNDLYHDTCHTCRGRRVLLKTTVITHERLD